MFLDGGPAPFGQEHPTIFANITYAMFDRCTHDSTMPRTDIYAFWQVRLSAFALNIELHMLADKKELPWLLMSCSIFA